MMNVECLNIPTAKGELKEKDILVLALNINLDLVKPGTLMSIKSSEGDEEYVGQVFCATPNSLSLFYVDCNGDMDLKEFHIDSFTNGSYVPYIISA